MDNAEFVLSEKYLVDLQDALQYLEYGDFQNAYELFDERLKVNPKCAGAYWGKVLINSKCCNIEEYIRTHVSRIPIDQVSVKEVKIPDEFIPIVQRCVENYCVNNYLSEGEIRRILNPAIRYQTNMNALQDFYNRAVPYFKNNDMINLAIKYAEGEFAERISYTIKLIVDKITVYLENSKKKEAEIIEQSKNKYPELMKQAEEKVISLHRQAINKREEDYTKACELMVNASTEADYMQAADMFFAIGNYRDCQNKREFCDAKVKEFFNWN